MHRRVAPSVSTQSDERLHGGTYRPTKRAASSSTKPSAAYLFIILALVGLLIYQNEASKRELNAVLNEEKHQIGAIQSELELQKSIFEQERKQLKNELQHAQKKDSASAQTGEADQSEFFRGQVDHLREEMKKSAKFNAIEKFGKGPHRVEIQLEFPPEEIPEGTEDKFIIEMAPLDLMPYTVNFFLEQVSRGLLDGNSFHRNAGHVVQGGPTPNHTNKGTNLMKPFVDAGLTSVAFQEYSADFPHVKYTLGYAGRPGGPDFYVSTVDNTKNHGPGGQSSYAVKDEADPCFAKVVEGFAAVDRMHKMSRQPGGYQRMKHYVAILHAKILS